MNKLVISLLGLTTAVILPVVLSAQAQPGVIIQRNGTNQVSITVTNGASTNRYELYRRIFYDDQYTWRWQTTGSPGQTNFIADMGVESQGFFVVGEGQDWDNDGADNSIDANPNNPWIKALQITIDSPLDGEILN